jgi:hypothetical protein
MPALLSAALDYGGYVSLINVAVYVLSIFGWLPFVNWVYTDSQSVRAKTKFWTSISASIGAVSLLVWLIAPFFIKGLVLYIIALGAVMI